MPCSVMASRIGLHLEPGLARVIGVHEIVDRPEERARLLDTPPRTLTSGGSWSRSASAWRSIRLRSVTAIIPAPRLVFVPSTVQIRF